jgi:Transposase DDE domain group 1
MRFADPFTTTQEDTRKVKTQTTSQTVEVRADGEGLVSHAGAFILVELADRLGLTAGLCEAMTPTRERRSAHDPGVVVRDLAVSVADGGDCVTDLGVLRGQEALFGRLPRRAPPTGRSNRSTLWCWKRSAPLAPRP